MAKHKLDELFSDGLENFEPAPAASAWEQIENRLDKKQGKSYRAWIAIAASAALLLASSWLMLTQTSEQETDSYAYAEAITENPALPAEVVYVPVYIYTVTEQPAKVITQPAPKFNKQKEINTISEEPALLAENEEITVEQPEIITLEDVPLVTAEEAIIASNEIAIDNEPAQLEPVTIIYKQGEPAKQSNFVKAMNYMEDVRMGDKKLVNFDKLRENFRSRFRSEEGTD